MLQDVVKDSFPCLHQWDTDGLFWLVLNTLAIDGSILQMKCISFNMLYIANVWQVLKKI